VYLRSFTLTRARPSIHIILKSRRAAARPHTDIDESNFFTLSSFGVTHLLNGTPDFTELEQWKREHYLFNAIIRIPIFKQYRVWKPYKVWRDSVRYGKMNKCRKVLNKNLFWLNPAFQAALYDIRGMCENLQNLRLLILEPGVVYTLEHFFQCQQKQRSLILDALEDFWAHAIQVIKTACVETLESLEEDLFGGQAKDPVAASLGLSKINPRYGVKNPINPRYLDPNFFLSSLVWTYPDGAQLLRRVAPCCRAPQVKTRSRHVQTSDTLFWPPSAWPSAAYSFSVGCATTLSSRSALHSLVVESVTELLDQLHRASQAEVDRQAKEADGQPLVVKEPKDPTRIGFGEEKKKEPLETCVFVTEPCLSSAS